MASILSYLLQGPADSPKAYATYALNTFAFYANYFTLSVNESKVFSLDQRKEVVGQLQTIDQVKALLRLEATTRREGFSEYFTGGMIGKVFPSSMVYNCILALSTLPDVVNVETGVKWLLLLLETLDCRLRIDLRFVETIKNSDSFYAISLILYSLISKPLPEDQLTNLCNMGIQRVDQYILTNLKSYEQFDVAVRGRVGEAFWNMHHCLGTEDAFLQNTLDVALSNQKEIFRLTFVIRIYTKKTNWVTNTPYTRYPVAFWSLSTKYKLRLIRQYWQEPVQCKQLAVLLHENEEYLGYWQEFFSMDISD